ncbi:MAG: hypothetical protein HQK53_04140 [Oligoflexia bacterium]|nr:hypothetical protein [Oligoflexia bacterium]
MSTFITALPLAFFSILSMTLSLTLCLSLSLCNSTIAAIPTPESLFRNAQNAPVNGSIAKIKLKISEINEFSASTSISTSQKELVENTGNNDSNTPLYLTITFAGQSLRPSIGKENEIALLQEIYSKEKMPANSLLTASLQEKFFSLLSSVSSSSSNSRDKQNSNFPSELSSNQKLFYATLFSLFLNRADAISSFLISKNSEYPLNISLINSNKILLMKRYREYLAEIKRNPALKKSIRSPLSLSDVEPGKKNIAIWQENVFLPSDKVYLEKDGPSFFIKISLKNSEVLFTNESHLLRRILLSDKTEITADKYLLIDGHHNLPSYMTFKTDRGKTFAINIISVEYSTASSEIYLSRTIGSHDKKNLSANGLSKSSLIPDLIDKLPFIYIR